MTNCAFRAKKLRATTKKICPAPVPLYFRSGSVPPTFKFVPASLRLNASFQQTLNSYNLVSLSCSAYMEYGK